MKKVLIACVMLSSSVHFVHADVAVQALELAASLHVAPVSESYTLDDFFIQEEARKKAAAIKIQSAVRSHKARLELAKRKLQAAEEAVEREKKALEQEKEKEKEVRGVAAIKIQSAVRSHKARLELAKRKAHVAQAEVIRLEDLKAKELEEHQAREAIKKVKVPSNFLIKFTGIMKELEQKESEISYERLKRFIDESPKDFIKNKAKKHPIYKKAQEWLKNHKEGDTFTPSKSL